MTMSVKKKKTVNDLQAGKRWFQNPSQQTVSPRHGMGLTAGLVSLVLVCVIGLLSASLFGFLQQRERTSRMGGRYSPELQQYFNEQKELLNRKPYWKVKSSDDSRTLVIPIDTAMQSVVRQYP